MNHFDGIKRVLIAIAVSIQNYERLVFSHRIYKDLN